MLSIRNGQRGQVSLEVAIMFGAVVAAFIAVAVYFQRGVQGGLKSNADSIGTQFSSTHKWTSRSRSAGGERAASLESGQFTINCQALEGAVRPANCDPTLAGGTAEDPGSGKFAVPPLPSARGGGS